MPESHELYRVFLGEFHWAPAYAYHNKSYHGQTGWTRGDKNSIPAEVLPTSSLYLKEGTDYDCSIEDSIHIHLPCGWLADGMKLRWRGTEGRYFNKQGELIAFDPSVGQAGPAALLMNKDRLLEFLDAAGYALFWTLLGEKQMIGGRDFPREWKGRLTISGAYRLHDGVIKGTTTSTYEAPT
jgi:hypothetical protein